MITRAGSIPAFGTIIEKGVVTLTGYNPFSFLALEKKRRNDQLRHLKEFYSKLLNVSGQNRHGNITFKAANAMIWTHIQAMYFQGINRRFYC